MSFVKTPKQEEATKILAGPAHHVLLTGGSRSGKTLLLLYAIAVRCLRAPHSTHCIIRRVFKDVKQTIGLTSFPQMMRLCLPTVEYTVNRAEWYIDLVAGYDENNKPVISRVWLAGLDDIAERDERILGREFSTLFFNEVVEIAYSSVITALTRLAEKNVLVNKAYYDCNPTSKKHWVYRLFVDHLNPTENLPVAENDYAIYQLNPIDNLDNLDSNYLETLKRMPARKRKRFLDGQWADEERGKLWQREWIDDNRVQICPQLRRIVVAIDPAVSANKASDDFGISIAGVGRDRHFYVLEDATMQGITPARWGQRVVELYREYQADCVVAEVNQGGDLVEANIHNVDDTVPVHKVHASRNKYLRAEPIANLYERGRVHHVQSLPELEEELVAFNPEIHQRSPGRLDSLVYSLTELAETGVLDPKVRVDDEVSTRLSEQEYRERQQKWTRELVHNEAVWT